MIDFDKKVHLVLTIDQLFNLKHDLLMRKSTMDRVAYPGLLAATNELIKIVDSKLDKSGARIKIA